MLLQTPSTFLIVRLTTSLAACSSSVQTDADAAEAGAAFECTAPFAIDPGGRCAQWRSRTPMTTARARLVAVLLENGKVLVAGGPDMSTEIYDPVANSWSPTALATDPHFPHVSAALKDGRVLVIGSQNHPRAERDSPTENRWEAAGRTTVKRLNTTASLLPEGSVLVVGGYDGE